MAYHNAVTVGVYHGYDEQYKQYKFSPIGKDFCNTFLASNRSAISPSSFKDGETYVLGISENFNATSQSGKKYSMPLLKSYAPIKDMASFLSDFFSLGGK